ncbi:MAG: Flp pilus assembly protein CpaB [Chloroflexota bacterium]
MKGIGGKGVLALSIVLGLATSFMVYRFMQQASQEARPVHLVPVLTAAEAIPARTVLTTTMLRLTQVPAHLRLSRAMVSAGQATGKVTKMPISPGEQILAGKLFGDRRQSGLAFVIPPGKRAVAVAISQVVDSGGLIVPGDRVDVVAVVNTRLTQNIRTAQPNTSIHAEISAVAQYILQDVEVLAVAQTIEGQTTPPSTAQQAARIVVPSGNQRQPARQNLQPQPTAQTATLAVTPRQAEELVLAEDKGRIRLVLRPYGDNSTIPVPDQGLFTTIGGTADLKTQPRPL